MAPALSTRRPRIRPLAWGAAAALLCVPAIAMRFTAEVNWTASDFVAMGGLLLVTGLAIELAVRLTHSPARRLVATAAIVAVFLLVWAELAVGIVD